MRAVKVGAVTKTTARPGGARFGSCQADANEREGERPADVEAPAALHQQSEADTDDELEDAYGRKDRQDPRPVVGSGVDGCSDDRDAGQARKHGGLEPADAQTPKPREQEGEHRVEKSLAPGGPTHPVGAEVDRGSWDPHLQQHECRQVGDEPRIGGQTVGTERHDDDPHQHVQRVDPLEASPVEGGGSVPVPMGPGQDETGQGEEETDPAPPWRRTGVNQLSRKQ